MTLLSRRRRIGNPNKISFAPFLGMILMMASLFLYATSGVIAPWYGVVALLVVWLLLFVLCCAWWTPHPSRLPVVGVASMVIWFCSLIGGGYFLDWSA